uniref:Transmembrane protein n=1 Tax=Chenopodium quinoa TaxID=63459 RepID=A0A803MF61_CHEQI
MNGLDSPLESLAFIPVNLGPLLSAVVNNIWAWLAVVTAAVSFWRIHNSSIKTTSSSSHIFLSPPPTPEPAPTVPKTTPFERENDENEDGEVDGGDYNDDDEVDEEKNEWVMIKRWGSSSELTVEMRGGDLGWYSYQNRKVIDGSVVRLWGEEGEIGCGSPRSCRKRVYSSRKLSTSNSF